MEQNETMTNDALRIEAEEPGTDAFYREVISVANQYKRILKNPDKKVKDVIKSFRTDIILSLFMLLLIVIDLIVFGYDGVMVIVGVVMAALAFVCYKYLKSAKSYIDSMKKDWKSVFTADENGVEVYKEGNQTLRMDWNKVAFVKQFPNSLGFIPKDIPGFVFSIQNNYAPQVIDYLKRTGRGDLIK